MMVTLLKRSFTYILLVLFFTAFTFTYKQFLDTNLSIQFVKERKSVFKSFMSTKDSCKFHDINKKQQQQQQHEIQHQKRNILIQKNYTKVFVFLLKKLSKWTENLWCWIFVALVVVVVHFDWVKSHLGNLDSECLLLLYVNNFCLFFSKTFFYIFIIVVVVVVVVSWYYKTTETAFSVIHTVGLITKAHKMGDNHTEWNTFYVNRLLCWTLIVVQHYEWYKRSFADSLNRTEYMWLQFN